MTTLNAADNEILVLTCYIFMVKYKQGDDFVKVKLSVTIEIDEKKYPNLSKTKIKSELQGCFDGYMQQVEEETKNLLADMNVEAK